MYKRIRDLREDNDYKQSDVAEVLNITQQQYSKIEIGITEITADILIKLSEFYNVSVDYLLGKSNNC
ncbi:MAG: helix-turn-helix domain-containing protein [Eubacterium sp.]|nr:helix-turn-helix domain-containing protein [Eubacterium sp.]